MKPYLMIISACLLFSSCSPDLERYKQETPILQPDRFFNGRLNSWGFFQNSQGQAVKRFKMQADAKWQGDHGTMDEYFMFNDGSTQERHWTFAKTGDDSFVGTAPDVTGDAKGTVYGNTLHWVYTITLNVDNKPHTVTFNDWLYLIDDSHMFSMVQIKKFGLPVGKLTMFFTKQD